LITEEDMRQEPVRQHIVLQGNGYTYFTRQPSDLQCPPDDTEMSSDYNGMCEEIAKVPGWMSLLGEQKPPAANEGFKVAGSSFFTVEIPEEWDLKMLEGSVIGWDLFEKENWVGGIDLVPVTGGKTQENNQASDNMLTESLFNEEKHRQLRITLDAAFADRETMAKIRDSVEFMGGPFNVVDIQSNAEQYIAAGGQKVFGKIADITWEQGKPVSVTVNVLEFVTDEADNTPNGFRINDLKRTQTFPLDFGVQIVPLVAPNYNAYGLYEMPLLDEDFIRNYGDYKNFYYDFILDGNGQLKIILGHYVP
jgi:hypothetical protein